MKVKELLKSLSNMKSPLARPERLGNREVQDRVLDSLERQRQAQLNQERKRELQAEIMAYQRRESGKSLDDGVRPLRDNGVGYRVKKPKSDQSYYNRGNVL